MNIEQMVAEWTETNRAQVDLARGIEHDLGVALAEACEAERVYIRGGQVLPRDLEGPTPQHARTAALVATARSMQFFHLLYEVGHSDALVRATDLEQGARFRVPGEDAVYTRYDLLSSDEFDTACYAVKDGETDIWTFHETQEVIRV